MGVLWPQLSKVLKPVNRGDCINCETWYFFSDPAFVWPSFGRADFHSAKARS